ncbi:MAG: PQQ-dependent catabolism-associated CXXCW motif protein [Paracraurococcus sp.]
MTRRRLLLAAVLLGAGPAPPEGYRMQDYRAPTPETVPGGRAIDTAEAALLFERQGAVWIDVLAAPRRPEGLPPGALWRPSPRLGIPGSLWLPEVGRGAPAPETEAWFRRMLEQATDGNRARPVVFYCLADCWMSWNAAKRAAAWGWRRVLWYRDGTDGWEAAGLPTEVLHPAPGWE